MKKINLKESNKIKNNTNSGEISKGKLEENLMRKSIQIKKINIIESFKDPNINNSINLKNKPCNIFFSPKTRNKFNNKLKSNTIIDSLLNKKHTLIDSKSKSKEKILGLNKFNFGISDFKNNDKLFKNKVHMVDIL